MVWNKHFRGKFCSIFIGEKCILGGSFQILLGEKMHAGGIFMWRYRQVDMLIMARRSDSEVSLHCIVCYICDYLAIMILNCLRKVFIIPNVTFYLRKTRLKSLSERCWFELNRNLISGTCLFHAHSYFGAHAHFRTSLLIPGHTLIPRLILIPGTHSFWNPHSFSAHTLSEAHVNIKVYTQSRAHTHSRTHNQFGPNTFRGTPSF